jgi:chromosome segregation protein
LRLKHIHLAGFKSFVDPVSIPASTNLTGIVGPNGCGKSNVIDAVRWVLGESKARELRGETLQDVIFNGSTQRKPASRAVVELLFDNSDGRAPGAWAAYAEIAVKRVLTRKGDSGYFLNNLRVRRRDITDLILGTGLGGDAYAIIEQGTISRLIEARPEELRGHLEEAAGISKYRERRREAEGRLKDTRENLARVDDVRIELRAQIERLSAQAEVARRYFELQAEQHWRAVQRAFVQRREGEIKEARIAQDLTKTQIEIEASAAAMHQAHAKAEAEREQQQRRSGALNLAQAAYYETGAEVTRLEQVLTHLRVHAQRVALALQKDQDRRQQLAAEGLNTEQEQGATQAALTEAEAHSVTLTAALQTQRAAVSAFDAAVSAARAAHAASQRQLAGHQQDTALARTQGEHAQRNLHALLQRRARLDQELAALPAPDAAEEARLEAAQTTAEAALAQAEATALTARQAFLQAEEDWRSAHTDQVGAERAIHHCDAQHAALTRLQQQGEQAEAQTAAWLTRHALGEGPRLWQLIRVEPRWETAVEAILGPRLEALAQPLDQNWLDDLPTARLDFPLANGAADAAIDSIPLPAGIPRLIDLVRCTDAGLSPFVSAALAGVGGVEDLAAGLDQHGALAAGALLVTREGHVLSAHGVALNVPDPARLGRLRRVRELAELAADLTRLRQDVRVATQTLQAAEAARSTTRKQHEVADAALRTQQTQGHQVQLRVQQSRAASALRAARRAQIVAEQGEIAQQQQDEQARLTAAESNQAEAHTAHTAQQATIHTQRQALQQAEAQVAEGRAAEREAQQAVQQGQMHAHTLALHAQGLRAEAQRRLGEAQQLEARIAEVQAEAAAMAPEAQTMIALDLALNARTRAEHALIAAREALETSGLALRNLEQARSRAEQTLDPLRARLQGLELKRQEVQIKTAAYAEQLQQQRAALTGAWAALASRGEAAIATSLTPDDLAPYLAETVMRLGREIEALGAVNMVALAELETAQTRIAYLDAQATDLETALATLEGAIARIDSESRVKLQAVYDRVSVEFKGFFNELFGGGEAQLVLTGEDILEAGLSIIAQPPGKKNSSIHLLSGGEKALTALSLVFALFRLNPAPFCLLDEVDAPLDDSNTERYCRLVQKMSAETQFLFITHNRLTMEMARHLIGVTMPEPGVSRPVMVDVEDALRMTEAGLS